MERRRRSVTSATEIETPYNAYSLTAEGITGGRNLLWVLYSLSISDKHRVIPVWGSSALLGMFHLPRTSSHAEFRKSIRSRTSPNGPFKHGHKVQSFSFPEGRDANPVSTKQGGLPDRHASAAREEPMEQAIGDARECTDIWADDVQYHGYPVWQGAG